MAEETFEDLPDALTVEQSATTTEPPKKNKGGRPPSDIDLKKVEAFCQINATDEEIAAHFGVCEKTIERLRKKHPGVFLKGHADRKLSLRRLQWQSALGGSERMQIHLGEQWLGQTRKQEISGPKGGPIQIQNVRQMLDGLSEEQFLQLARESGVTLPESDAA